MFTLYIVTNDGQFFQEDFSTIELADNASDFHEDEDSLVFFSHPEAMRALSQVRDTSWQYKEKLKSWVNNP